MTRTPHWASNQYLLMADQALLGGIYALPAVPGGGRTTLRTGRVTSPVSPAGNPKDFQAYVDRCLRTWSVDVLLDSGEYVPYCRIVSPQSNGREGLRRMFRMPMAATAAGGSSVVGEGTTTFGDLVVVGFVNGQTGSPVVLGSLTPMMSTTASADVMESAAVTTTDVTEWQDRHDHLNLDDPTNPLPSSTMARDTGLTRETEHQTQTRVNGQVVAAHILDRDLAARSTEHEQVVQGESGVTGVIRRSNTEAQDLTHLHSTIAGDASASVVIEDLKAQVLQLTQQMSTLYKLVLRSDQAKTLTVQQHAESFQLTVVSDAESKTATLLHEDLDEHTQGGLTLAPSSQVVLRRSTNGSPESVVMLNADGSITLRSASGTAVHLDQNDVLITSKSTTVLVSETNGVSVTTKGGSVLSIEDDSMVMTAPAVTVRTPQLHLNSGVVRVGDTGGAGSGVPVIETLYTKLGKVETAISSLYSWAASHTHTATGSTSPTTPPTSRPAGSAPVGQFNEGTAQGDALQTFRGE